MNHQWPSHENCCCQIKFKEFDNKFVKNQNNNTSRDRGWMLKEDNISAPASIKQ